MAELPDGWTTAPGADGHTVASKFVDGGYFTVEVPDGNDLAAAVNGVEQEYQLRAQAKEDEKRKVAADLRAEADALDPDVTVEAPEVVEPSADPNQTAPADPVKDVLPEAPAEETAPEAAPVGAEDDADASETTTEGA